MCVNFDWSMFFLTKFALYLHRLHKNNKSSTVFFMQCCVKYTMFPRIIRQNIFFRQIAINLCTQAKEISKMEYIKEKLKYHRYNYSVYCEEMAQENGIIPHIDLSAAVVQLFLNIPILVVKTSFTHNPTTNKKEWFCVV